MALEVLESGSAAVAAKTHGLSRSLDRNVRCFAAVGDGYRLELGYTEEPAGSSLPAKNLVCTLFSQEGYRMRAMLRQR